MQRRSILDEYHREKRSLMISVLGAPRTALQMYSYFVVFLVGLSSCTQRAPKPPVHAVVVPNKVNANENLPRLELNLIAPADDGKSALVWPSMPTTPTPGPICRITFGARAPDDAVKCTTASPLHTVISASPKGRWFAAVVANELRVFDTTNMTVVHHAPIEAHDHYVDFPMKFRADDVAVAYMDGRGRMVVVDLTIDNAHNVATPHSIPRKNTTFSHDLRGVRWIGNDRVLTFASGIAPQIHTLALDNSMTSISLDSAETNWIGADVRVLPGDQRLLVADASGFVGEFDARTGKQLFTYRNQNSDAFAYALVQHTASDRFLITQRSEGQLALAVFGANVSGALWTRQVPGGFDAELSSDGQRVAYVLEKFQFPEGLDWHSTIVNLAEKTEKPIPGVFLTWAKDAWFAHERGATLRDNNGVIFERDVAWAPWFEPVHGTNTVWFGGGASFLRVQDGGKVPLEFEIAGTADDPWLRIKADPR